MCGTNRAYTLSVVKRIIVVIILAAVLTPSAHAENVTAVLAKYKANAQSLDSTRLHEAYVDSVESYLSEFSDWAQGKTLKHAQSIGKTGTEQELCRVAALIDEAALALKSLRHGQYALIQGDATLRSIKECEDDIRMVSEQLNTLNNTYFQLLASYDSFSFYDGLISKYSSAEDVELAHAIMEHSKTAYAKAAQFDDIGEVKNLKSPLNNDKFLITSKFGYRNDPFGQGVRFHSGLDLSANTGDAIRSLFSGVVVIASEGSTGYGNYVVIDHGNGFKTLYAHASMNLVSAGQTVKQYEKIQLAGSSGRSTGPHLHLGVFVDNALVDPIKLFYD